MVLFNRILPLFALASLVLNAAIAASPFSEPAAEEAISEDGTIRLAWHPEDEDAIFEVRRSEYSDFRESILIYEGRDTATFVSGLPEGTFHIKLRAKGSQGSYPEWADNSLLLKVQYIDSTLVAVLMSAGALTFIAIIAAIVTGHRKTSRQNTL